MYLPVNPVGFQVDSVWHTGGKKTSVFQIPVLFWAMRYTVFTSTMSRNTESEEVIVDHV